MTGAGPTDGPAADAASPARILLVGGSAELRGLAAAGPEIAVRASDDVADGGVGEPPPVLVAVDGTAAHAYATTRALRRRQPTLALVVLVPEALVDTTRTRIALTPELERVRVLSTDRATPELLDELRQLATVAARGDGVRRALDAMNQHLGGGTGERPEDRPPGVSERYLAALVRHAPVAIVSVDPTGRVVTLNEAAETLLRCDLDAAEGAPFEDLLGDEDPGEVGALLVAATDGEPHRGDGLVLVRPGGERRIVAATSAPVLDDAGTLIGVVLLAADVTEQRRSEERLQQLQKAESLATLASGVAHDFNNLLVSVHGWASLAADDPSDSTLVTEALEQIQDASQRAGELARSLLAYGGRGEFVLTDVAVDDLLRGLQRLLRASVDRRTELRFELGLDAVTVAADATQLRQVLLNLVLNADEALGGRPGTVTVRSRLVRHAEPHEPLPAGEHVCVEVVDDGPGVPEEHRARLFDPFFTTRFAGRGLGLAASHGIVRGHGGTLTLHDTPGGGATFRVLLPRAAGDDEEPT